MRPDRAPWLTAALVGVAAVAVVLIAVALATGDDGADDEEDAVATTPATTVVVETETATQTETETATGGDTDGAVSVVVPDVEGLTLVAAGERAEEAGLIADSYPVESDAPAGEVVAQDPAAGSEVAPTRRLRVDVSVGPGGRETVRVPDVTGPQAPRARRIAWERGFTTLTADRDAPSAEEVGEVILQEPGAGTQAPALSQITLYVGR